MSHNPSRTIQLRAAANRGRPCNVPYCGAPRHNGGSLYCPHHRTAHRLYGHPRGVRIWPRDYKAERIQVANLIAAHPDHAGIKSALAFLTGWLRQAAQGDPAAIALTEMARLARNGVTARMVLVEAAALWLFAHRNPNRVPDDARLTFALAIAALYLAPGEQRKKYLWGGRCYYRYNRAHHAQRQEVGEAIRRPLALLFQNIAETIDREATERAEARRALYEPFNTTNTTPRNAA